jgi:hypothetical protein
MNRLNNVVFQSERVVITRSWRVMVAVVLIMFGRTSESLATPITVSFTVADPAKASGSTPGQIHTTFEGWKADGVDDAHSGSAPNQFVFDTRGGLAAVVNVNTLFSSQPASAFANWSISGTYTLESNPQIPAGTVVLGELEALFSGINQATAVSSLTGAPTVTSSTLGTFAINPFGVFGVSAPAPNPAMAQPLIPFLSVTAGGPFGVPISRSMDLTVGTRYLWNMDLSTNVAVSSATSLLATSIGIGEYAGDEPEPAVHFRVNVVCDTLPNSPCQPVAPVPEPSSLLLLGAGVLSLYRVRSFRRVD